MMESERGWGQDFWNEDYDTREEALARVEKINGENTAPVAPDLYYQATYLGPVEVEEKK